MKIIKIVSAFKRFFKTMLEIIEDKPNFLIPDKIYILIVCFYFFQLSGYIFCSSQSRQLNEQLFLIFAHINEVSTFTFMLSMKGSDTLTYIFFGIIQFFIYSYYIYIIGLTIAKKYSKIWVQQNRNKFKAINQALNIFFTFYYWVFQIPFLEINLGLLSCNENAFLIEFQTKGCDQKPLYIIILASFGGILSIFTGFMIMFFFRNYEFFERNLLKRKFNKWQIPQLLSYFLFMYIYFIQNQYGSTKYFASQVVGIIQLTDLIINYPFRNSLISKAYAIGCSYFEVSMLTIFIWTYTQSIYDTDLFYIMVFAVMLLSFLLYAIQNNQHEIILHLTSENFSKLYTHLDFYFEELVRFGIDQQKNEYNRFKLFQIIGYHKQTCIYSDCYCKKTDFKDSKDNLNYQDLLTLIDDLFKRYLNNKIISSNIYEREHLYLKYISFIANFRNNPIRAYYELKNYLAQTKIISFYFSTVSKVLSANMEKQIFDKQETYFSSNTKELEQQIQIREEVTTKEVELTEKIKSTFIPLFQNFIRQKIDYWTIAKKGFLQIDDFYSHTINFSQKSMILKHTFKKFITSNKHNILQEKNAIISKVIFQPEYSNNVDNMKQISIYYYLEFLLQINQLKNINI